MRIIVNFEKIILFYLLVQIDTIITKNINFEILANIPSFLRNEKFLGLGNPGRESGTPAYLRSFKMLPIDFLFSQIFTAFWLLVQDLRSFKCFFEKISMAVISSLFRFFAVPVSRKIYLLLQLRYQDALFCILLATKVSIKISNRFLNFCHKIFLELFIVNFFFEKNQNCNSANW